MCHHIIGVLKWTRDKWSMNIPWCATCHHPNAKNFNIEINPMNYYFENTKITFK
jgi:hypothetical protein